MSDRKNAGAPQASWLHGGPSDEVDGARRVTIEVPSMRRMRLRRETAKQPGPERIHSQSAKLQDAIRRHLIASSLQLSTEQAQIRQGENPLRNGVIAWLSGGASFPTVCGKDLRGPASMHEGPMVHGEDGRCLRHASPLAQERC